MAVFVSKGISLQKHGPVILDNFADNDWATIIYACQTRNVPESWVVGSQKIIDIGSYDYTIDIIGLYHDDYADGSGKAPITFQMHDCYASSMGYHNASPYGNRSWKECYARTNYLPSLLLSMPAEIGDAVKKVNKLTLADRTTGVIGVTADKLFLLSEVEIFGSTTYSAAGEGTQYAYYANGNGTIKYLNGTATSWWERSIDYDGNQWICYVSADGSPSITNAATSGYGLAPAFCF